jgi:hypothetical protein
LHSYLAHILTFRAVHLVLNVGVQRSDNADESNCPVTIPTYLPATQLPALLRHIPRLRIHLGCDRHVGHSVDLPPHQSKLEPLGADKLWQSNLLLGDVWYFTRHYRCVHSHPPTAGAKNAATTESREEGIDSRFLSRILVSINFGITAHSER